MQIHEVELSLKKYCQLLLLSCLVLWTSFPQFLPLTFTLLGCTGICAVTCLWVAQLWRWHEVILLWFAVKQREHVSWLPITPQRLPGLCFVFSWFWAVSSDENMSKCLLEVKNITSSNLFCLKSEFIFTPSQKHPPLQSYLGSFFNLPLSVFIKKYLCLVPFTTLFTARRVRALEKLIWTFFSHLSWA